MELQVIITRGLPASGKSTWADKYIAQNPNFVKIEKDDIRKKQDLFKDGIYKHKRGDEDIVLRERNRLIRQALSTGKSVISSDTNLAKKHITKITNIANEFGAKVEIKDFLDVPIAELIKRDSKRQNSVGEQVIRQMFHQYVKTLPTFLGYDPNLEYVICFDIDGTLTNGPKDRSPYDWKKVGNDDLNLGASAVIDGLSIIGLYKIFLFSGRNEVCRPETEAWLDKQCIKYDKLFMRPADRNSDKDTIIKSDLIEENIRGKYNVLFWVDDRPVVVRMLKDVYGIDVWARGDQKYEF